jgi:hypothetical protein
VWQLIENAIMQYSPEAADALIIARLAVWMPTCYARVKNIGWNGAFTLLGLIPIVCLFLFVFPPGYKNMPEDEKAAWNKKAVSRTLVTLGVIFAIGVLGYLSLS